MKERTRRLRAIIFMGLCLLLGVGYEAFQYKTPVVSTPQPQVAVTMPVVQGRSTATHAAEALESVQIKGRAPKTGYTRSQFYGDWNTVGACDMRNFILARDLQAVKTVSAEDCNVTSGTLQDPYTGRSIVFSRGPGSSSAVQIDHVVALSDAWQKGAQSLSTDTRRVFANDPLNLLAVDGPANQAKSDGDAATWLPPNKDYRCRYVARQLAVKLKYSLWLTQAEHDAMQRILQTCPDQQLPVVAQ